MAGTKTNERPGTRCVVRRAGFSASKARQVLDLVRGLTVEQADEILQFTEREAAGVIRKALTSAVANAEHNDNQNREELAIVSCFADESETMKRMKPGSRGRSGKIRKRTCTITVIVGRMSDQQLEKQRTKDSGRPVAGRRGVRQTAATRRDRVAKSRQADAESTDVVPQDLVSSSAVEVVAGIHDVLEDGSMPEGFPIKGNADSMLYHTPESRYYKQTKAEVWFATTEAAEAAGYAAPGSTSSDTATDDDQSGEGDNA